jgi:transcriptional regulator with XRE-family HTH domain
MSSELIEIDASALRNLLKHHEMSQYDLAARLEISTKTIQRWMNQSIRRVKPETIAKLCQVLGPDADTIKRDFPALNLRPTDKAVAEICSERSFQSIRLTDDWNRYLEILKSIHTETLSSEQCFVVSRNIGISSFYLGKFQAAKIHLSKAFKYAELLQNEDHKADIRNWSARLEEAVGNLYKADDYLNQNSQILHLITRRSVLAEYSYVRGRVHLHRCQNQDAETQFRQGLLTKLRTRTKPYPLLIAWMYLHLAHLYLRTKNYTKAQVCCLRFLKSAERSGWGRGILLANYYLGITESFKNGSTEASRKYFGKARVMHKNSYVDRFCPLLSQAEFLYFILNAQYDNAKTVLVHRMFKTRNAEFYLASTTIDGLILAKLNPGVQVVRKSMIARAKEYYRTQGIDYPQLLIQRIEERTQITPQEIAEFYYY